MAVYVPAKERAINLIGSFEFRDMKQFLERVFAGKVLAYAISPPDFTQSECAPRETKPDATNQDIVDAVLAEDELRKKEIGEGKYTQKKPKKKKSGKGRSEL